MKSFACFAFLCCFFASLTLFAQTPKAIEADLLGRIKKIDYWAMQLNNDTTGLALDSLSDVNSDFGNKLESDAFKYPVTIKLPFDSLVNAGLNIINTDDGCLRIYLWDTRMGGAQHEFSNIFQYKTRTGTDTLSDVPADPYGSPGPFDNIYQFIINGKTYYLIAYSNEIGFNDVYKGIMVFAIVNDKLETIKLIKTQSGLHSHLNCYYTSSVNDPQYDDGAYNIIFNGDNKTITLPLIDENNRITGKYITYKFTGQYFERVKN